MPLPQFIIDIRDTLLSCVRPSQAEVSGHSFVNDGSELSLTIETAMALDWLRDNRNLPARHDVRELSEAHRYNDPPQCLPYVDAFAREFASDLPRYGDVVGRQPQLGQQPTSSHQIAGTPPPGYHALDPQWIHQ